MWVKLIFRVKSVTAEFAEDAEKVAIYYSLPTIHHLTKKV